MAGGFCMSQQKALCSSFMEVNGVLHLLPCYDGKMPPPGYMRRVLAKRSCSHARSRVVFTHFTVSKNKKIFQSIYMQKEAFVENTLQYRQQLSTEVPPFKRIRERGYSDKLFLKQNSK